MIQKPFLHMLNRARRERRRLVVPLMGFPGLNLTGCTVKLAQQNFGEHFKVLRALADLLMPDAIFPLMDLSVEANALGRYTVFPKGESATVMKDDFCLDDLARIDEINISFDARLLGYVETVRLMSIGLPSSILRGAYVTGPYTLAALLMGADEAATATILHPDELRDVCQFAAAKVQEYVRLLIVSGAQLICLLEPSAVMLGPGQFEHFSARYVRQINDSCMHTGVSMVYHICGNSMHLVEKMSESGVDALSLDSREAGMDLSAVAERIPKNVAVMGNISPIGSLLKGRPDEVEHNTLQLLQRMDPYPNFVLGTGCDLPQETPIENIRALIRTGRNYEVKKSAF